MPSMGLAAYASTTTAGVTTAGVATNASWVGPWVPIDEATSVGVQVVMAATGSPVGTWGADVTADQRPEVGLGSVTDANINPGVTALTLTSAMTAQNPDGTTTDRNFLFQFDPAPRAKFFRFKLTISSGGSASQLLKAGVQVFGAVP